MDDVLLADLVAEHRVLDELVGPLPAEVWAKPSPSPGWTLAHQIHHLDVSEGAALLALTGHSDQVFSPTGRWPDRPLPPDPAEVLGNWRASRAASLEAMAALDAKAPVIWGDGPMTCRSFATARLMETWAHGLDCFATVGAEPTDTDRLRHVAHIGYRALPYAFQSQGITPAGPAVGAPAGIDRSIRRGLDLRRGRRPPEHHRLRRPLVPGSHPPHGRGRLRSGAQRLPGHSRIDHRPRLPI